MSWSDIRYHLRTLTMNNHIYQHSTVLVENYKSAHTSTFRTYASQNTKPRLLDHILICSNYACYVWSLPWPYAWRHFQICCEEVGPLVNLKNKQVSSAFHSIELQIECKLKVSSCTLPVYTPSVMLSFCPCLHLCYKILIKHINKWLWY